MRDHGTPTRNFRTPAGSVGDFSPINISPIRNFENDRMSCQSIKSRFDRPKSVARLDFTADMSVDEENKGFNPSGKHIFLQTVKKRTKNMIFLLYFEIGNFIFEWFGNLMNNFF